MHRVSARIGALCAALTWSFAVPLAAQAGHERAAIELFRDSLAGVTDSLALRHLEAATITLAKTNRDDPLIHLRLGFIAYRLGELAKAKSHYDDAAGEFEWASDLRPAWPFPWYGLGLAELAQGEHASIAIENLRQQLGLDYLSKAAKAFSRATQADPSFAQATIDLAAAALAQRIQPRLQVALQAVRLSAASDAAAVPEVQLARGRVEREVGEVDSALAAFGAYLGASGDSGVALFELARTQFLANRPVTAESSYFAGARAAASAAAVALYRTDLTYLADSAELVAFDAQPNAPARAAFLWRFWERRDIADARDPGDRLMEHNRRWLYVNRNFRLVSRHRHYDITETYRTTQAAFDDRGIIYLRHGEPDQRATYVTRPDTVEPNQSWLYRRRDGDLVFHFVARDDASDYKLVESLVDALGFRAGVQAMGTPSATVLSLYASRENFGPAYVRVARGGTLAGAAISTEREQGRTAILTGTTTDSYLRRFPVPLDVVVSDFVAGAGAASGGQALHVVFAIPADRLSPEPGGAGVLYPLRFRLVVTDPGDSVVARLDTIRVFTAPQALRAPSYLSGRLSVPVRPGRYRYRVLLATTDEEAGELVERDSVDVPTLDGRAFTASDIVVGRAGAGLVWVPRLSDSWGADTVVLDPLDRYQTGTVAELYYEVYGLAPGASYHTEVRLERQGGRSLLGRVRGLVGGGRPRVQLEFDAQARGPVTRVHRGVSLRGVSPGTYLLTVTLRDPVSGASVGRRHRLQVVGAP